MGPSFHPWRRRVEFFKGHQAPIGPLIPKLGFIRNPQKWGYAFRRGLFEVEAADFELIASAMKVRLPNG